MKTGLLTFYHIHHYGAMLQAYATERAVASLGSECEIIDYYVNQDNTLFQRPTGLGSAAHDAHTALHYGPLKARYERFEAFSRENLNISGRRYQSLEELRQAELPYDVLLSGSDQIWNPKIFPDGRFDPVFFGAFSHKRKIAYAPSFGIPRIPDGMEEELRTYLESFSHLSVRERQGQGIVRDITGKDVPVVLDPTLLLERTDWAAAARDGGAGRGYILCYCISRPDALAPYIRRLAEETGLPVVQLCGIRQKVHPRAHCVLDAGPAEFLGWFQGASVVCTNSFHGTVFSTQFQKPFFTAVAPAELPALLFASWRGWVLAAAVVLLSAAYPFTGFITRRVEGFLDDDRERVVNAFRAEGFVPADDDGEGMTFRAASPLRRLWLHFDDEVRVAQFGQWIELSGQRRTVARVAPRLEGYIAAHARTKE